MRSREPQVTLALLPCFAAFCVRSFSQNFERSDTARRSVMVSMLKHSRSVILGVNTNSVLISYRYFKHRVNTATGVMGP